MVGFTPPGTFDPNDNPVEQALKGALAGLDTIVSGPQRTIQGLLGPTMRRYQIASRIAANMYPGQYRYTPGGGHMPVGSDNPAILALGAQRARQEAQTATPQQQFERATEELPFPIRFGAQIATDPWSYVGLGLPGKAAQGVRAVGQGSKYATRLARALDYTNALDQEAAKLPGYIIGNTTKAGLKFLGMIPTGGVLHIRDAANISRPARTLGEWATATSRQGWFKQGIRTAANVADTLRQKGRSLDVDIANEQELKSMNERRLELIKELGQPQPTTTRQDLIAGNNQLFSQLRDSINRIADPHQKVWAYEILRAVDEQAKQIWDEAIAAQLSLRPISRSKSGKLIYSQQDYTTTIPEIYANAWYKTQAMLASGLREIHHGAPEAIYQFRVRMPHLVDKIVGNTLRETRNISGVYGKAIANQAPLPKRSLVEGGPQAMLLDRRNRELMIRYLAGSDKLRNQLVGGDYDAIINLARSRVAEMMPEADMVRRGFPIVQPHLPFELGQFTMNEWQNFIKHANEFFGDKQVVYDTLKLAWDRSQARGIPFPIPAGSFTIRDPKLRWQAVNNALQMMGKQPVTNIAELRNQLADTLLSNPSVAAKWDTMMSRWRDAEDILGSDPYEVVFGRVMRAKAKEYGVDTKPGTIKDILQAGTGLWAEQNLATLSYPVTNLLGGLVASKLVGVSPAYVVRNIGKNFSRMWRGEDFLLSDVERDMELTGQKIISGVSGSNFLASETPQKAFLGQNLSTSKRLGPLWLGLLGGSIGGVGGALQPDVDPDDRMQAILHGIAAGTVTGASLPYITRYLMQTFGVGIESTMRQSVFHLGYTDSVVRRIDDLVNEVRSAAGGVGPRTVYLDPVTQLRQPQRTQVATRGTQAIENALDSLLQKKNGMVSPQDVQSTLMDAGMEKQSAFGIAQFWQNELYQAQQDALKLTNSVHVDYEVLNNVEQFARTAMPFSTWPIKMIPFFAKHVLENPQVLWSLVNLNRLSQVDAERRGLTGRFKGSVQLGLGDAVFSALLGYPVEAFWNPLRGFLPFADVGRSFDRAQGDLENNQPVSALLSGLSAVGLGLHPLAELPIRLSGAESDTPAQGYLRWAEPLRGLEAYLGVNQGRGFDLNAGFTQIESKVREGVQGEAPTDLRKAAVLRRVDELALRDTGKSIASGAPEVAPYIAAKSSESGPIYLQAEQEVARERGLTSGLGFFAQALVPQALLSQEESDIRGAQVERREKDEQSGVQEVRDEIGQLLDAGKDQEPATPELKQRVLDLANQVPAPNGDPDHIRRLFDIGTNAAMDVILSETYPYPKDESSGYQTGGTPLESQLGREMDTFGNPAAILAEQGATPDQIRQAAILWQMYQNASPAERAQAASDPGFGIRSLLDTRDQYAQSHPLITGYFGYRDQNPNTRKGTQRDFIKALRAGKAK